MSVDEMIYEEDCELDESCQATDPDCGKSLVECVCPKCGVRHKMKLCWTGTGIPRKYCAACKKSVLSYDVGEGFHLNTSGK